MRKLFAMGTLFTAVILGLFYLASPERAVAQMETAMRTGDIDTIEKVVDLPALRRSYKSHVMQMMQQDKKLTAFLAKNPDKAAEADQALTAHATTEITAKTISQILTQAESNGPASGMQKLSQGWAIRKQDLQNFYAVHADPDGQLQLNFERQGLVWKIVGFELVGFDQSTIKDAFADQNLGAQF